MHVFCFSLIPLTVMFGKEVTPLVKELTLK